MSNFPCKCVTRFKIFLWLIIHVEVLNAVSISCHLVLKAFRYQIRKEWRIGLFSTENYSKWIFFPHFCFQRWEYFLMWSYAIIVSAGALQKTKLFLATVECKSFYVCCETVSASRRHFTWLRAVLKTAILWTGQEK